MPGKPFLTRWGQMVQRAGGELGELVVAHWELASLEAEETARSLARYAWARTIGVCLLVVAMLVVTLGASVLLAPVTGLSYGSWLILFGVGYGVVGGWTLLMVARRLWRGVRGFEQTIEQVCEDVIWLAELVGSNGVHIPEKENNPAREDTKQARVAEMISMD